MRGLAAGIVVVSIGSASLSAQERDPSLQRINLALQQPPVVRGIWPVESDTPQKLGIFTFVPPQFRGEMVRVSVPIGDLLTRGFNGIARAHQRRQAESVRRRVEAELKAVKAAR